MNGTLVKSIRRQLMPALEQSQGVRGTYARGDQSRPLVAVPTSPEWTGEDDRGVIEEWTELVFLVSIAAWEKTGFGLPEQGDRFCVTLADGVERTYALLPAKGARPYGLAAGGTHYSLRMKWVHA
jgi:hypothetical protein